MLHITEGILPNTCSNSSTSPNKYNNNKEWRPQNALIVSGTEYHNIAAYEHFTIQEN